MNGKVSEATIGSETVDVIQGKRVLVIGDLHLDDLYSGKHINYQKNTLVIMRKIYRQCLKYKPDVVIQAGDLIGVSTGKSKVRSRQYLLKVVRFLQGLAPEVYVVKGNHDFNLDSDYDFLAGIPVFRAPQENHKTICIKGGDSEEDQLFFHLRNYNDENTSIQPMVAEHPNALHTVVAHNEFYIPNDGPQPFDPSIAFDLTTHQPFFGADVVLSGHIHQPSAHPFNYHTATNKLATFLNLGCPTRPSSDQRYEKVWEAWFTYTDDKKWDYQPTPFTLPSVEETFTEESLVNGLNLTKDDAEAREELMQLLTIARERGLSNQLPLTEQIDRIPTISDQTKEMAKSYVKRAQAID